MENRTVDLHIRLTEKEASELKRKAKMCRITQSALVRILINGYEPRQAPGERFYEAMRQLSAVGNNLECSFHTLSSFAYIVAKGVALYECADFMSKKGINLSIDALISTFAMPQMY